MTNGQDLQAYEEPWIACGEGACAAGTCSRHRRHNEASMLRQKLEDLEQTARCAEEMRDASDARVRELVGALLDVEHETLTAQDPRDMYEGVLETVERALGKPPRPYAPRRRGEPAVPNESEEKQ